MDDQTNKNLNQITLVTLVPEHKTSFFWRTIKEFQADPDGKLYDYTTDEKSEQKTVPAEYHIFKRRQLTAHGAELPKNPCDDNGLPLFLLPDGKTTTKDTGEKAWGNWIDGSIYENRVSIKSSSVVRKNCGRGFYGDSLGKAESEAKAQTIITNDKQREANQQAKKVNPVGVDYRTELVKPVEPYTQYIYTVKREKVRDYPASWQNVAFNPANPQYTDVQPIHIAFHTDRMEKVDPKTHKMKMRASGVGNFAGRQQRIQELNANEIVAMYPLEKGAEKAGFKETTSYSSYPSYSILDPASKYVCKITVSRVDMPFIAIGYDMHRIESSERGAPLGGYFNKLKFEIIPIPVDERNRIKSATKQSSERGSYVAGIFIHDLKAYPTKAPAPAVEFCHQKFHEATKEALVKLDVR